jgi:ATP-dependent DNA helicase RecG
MDVSEKVGGKLGERWSERWSEKWSEKWSELNENQRRIIDLMEKKPGITRRELSEALKINQSAIQKHIDKLKKEGIIRRVGPAKSGHWEVVE